MPDTESSASSPSSSPAAEPPRERELKLLFPADQADSLLGHPLLASDNGRKPAAHRQISAYWDTADDALSRAGLTLRVRTIGKKRLQTVKTKGTETAGLFSRGEWEAPIQADVPEMTLLETWGLTEAFTTACNGQTIQTRFTTDVRRAKRVRNGGAARVEIALDRGEVVAGDRSDPIAEVELELLEGPPAHLYELALELNKAVPLQLGGLSKAARGYRLLGHIIPAEPVKAADPGLTRGMPAADAFIRIGQSCLTQITGNMRCLLETDDPEGVHQMRVGVRRMRAAMTTFKTLIDGPDMEVVKAELRWLMSLLGPARDADVFDDEVLAPLVDDLADEPGLPALRAHFADRRVAANAATRDAVRSARFTALVLEAARWLEDGSWRTDPDRTPLRAEPVHKLADRVLGRRHRKVLKAGKHYEALGDEERHALRIQIKKLRYGLEFLAPLYPAKKTKGLSKTLKATQDALGSLNDFAVGRALLRDAAREAAPGTPDLAFAAGRAAGLLGGHREEALATARSLWQDIASTKAPWL